MHALVPDMVREFGGAAFLGRLVLWCFCTSLGMYQNSHQECCLAAVVGVLRVCSSSVLPYALGPCSLPTTSAGRYVASDNQAVVFCGVAAKHGWLFCWGRCHLRTWHPVIYLLHGQGCIAVAGMAQRHQRAWLLVTVLHGHQEACLVGKGRGCLSWMRERSVSGWGGVGGTLIYFRGEQKAALLSAKRTGSSPLMHTWLPMVAARA